MALVLSTVVDCSAVVVHLGLLVAQQEWFGGATIVAPGEVGDTRSGEWRAWNASALLASRTEVAARVDVNLMTV